MARELAITYGSTNMGETPYFVNGKIETYRDPASAVVSWEVVCIGATEADFATNCNALESEFDERFQNLTVTFGSETHLSYSHSADTGFNAEPSIEKIGDVADTGRSRVYRCSVRFALPASDNSGRRWSNVAVSEDESKIRTLTITGQYTAQGGTGARANATTKLATYASSVRSSLGGTWDEALVTITTDDQDKTADFVLEQREVVYDETAAGANSTKIIRPSIFYRRTSNWPGDSPGKTVRRREIVTVSYSCGVDHTADTDLHTLWTGTVRPYLLSEAERVFGASTIAVVNENPALDASGNRVEGTMTLDVVISGGVFTYIVVQRVTVQPGTILTPEWDGKDWTYRRYRTKRVAMRTTVVTLQAEGLRDLAPVAGLGSVSGDGDNGAPNVPGDSGNWVLMESIREDSPIKIGDPELGTQIEATNTTWTIVEQYAEPPAEGGPVVTDTPTVAGGGDGATPYEPGGGGEPGNPGSGGTAGGGTDLGPGWSEDGVDFGTPGTTGGPGVFFPR